MLDKYFVPSDRALKLKEFGFDEVCLKLYVDGEIGESLRPWAYQHSKNKNILCAPLFCQAFDWFRENHNCFSSPTESDDNTTKKYDWLITKKLEDDKMLINFVGYRESYEEAQLACLDKLIEICS